MSYNDYQLSRRQRRQFATNNPVGVDTLTYAGELADFYVAPAMKAADTLANGIVTQLDGLSNKAVVTGASMANDIIQESSCDFNDGDSVTVDERVLTLNDLQVNESLCRKTILPAWWSVKGSRNSDWASPEFRNFVLATVAAKTAEGVENQIWNGYNYTTNDTIGFLSGTGTFNRAGLAASIMSIGGGVNGVAVTAITAANVIDAFSAVHSAAANANSAVLVKSDLGFYVGPKTFALYQQALATSGGGIAVGPLTSVGQGYNNQVTNQNLGTLTFLGVPIHRCPGMAADAIVLAAASNLFVGSNLRTDYTQVQYIPAYQYDGSDNVKVVMRFGLGMQIGTPGDVFLGTTAAILPA